MGNTESSTKLLLDDSIRRKTTGRGATRNGDIVFAVSSMKGWRPTMEDEHVHCTEIPLVQGKPLTDHCVFAVFDGHGGGVASKFLSEHLMLFLGRQPDMIKYASLAPKGDKSRSDVTGIRLLRKSLEKTFAQLDEELIKMQLQTNAEIVEGRRSQPPALQSVESENIMRPPSDRRAYERSGSTGVVVMITPTHVICANTGDSRAVLRRSGKVLPLSIDHKPTDTSEKRRVIAAGGTVKRKRVDGDLAVSRAFGDFLFKTEKSKPADQQKIICKPDLLVYPRDFPTDEFIVIACDGIWDVASNKQCSEFVQMLLSQGEVDLGNICEETLDTCLDRNSRDNMTMMLVGLPAMKYDATTGATMTNAIWGHRTSRRVKDFTESTTSLGSRAVSVVSNNYFSLQHSVAV